MKINEHALKFIFNETLFRQEENTISEIDTNINFLGKNKKGILVFVPSNEKVIEENDKVFLLKILTSIGLHLDDIVITTPQKEDSFNFYKKTFSPSKIILFGVKPFEIDIKDIEVPTYEIKDFDNLPILHIDSLMNIQNDLAKKKALWTNLKQLF